MAKLKQFFSISLAFAFLSACSHLDNSCLEINWHELGRQDSAKGLKMSESFAKRRGACPIEKSSIYAKAYENGFSAGLKEYCNFKTGYIYSLSQMGKEVSACPEGLRSEFIKGYEIGSYMKQIQSLQNEVQARVQTAVKKLESHESRFSMIER